MPKYTLTYFPVRARGETARMLFALAGQEYEDKRVPLEEWPAMKPTTPLGQLPLLSVDGKPPIWQSTAINRFLAREFGLAGGSSLEQAQVDAIMGSADDVAVGIINIFFAPTPEVKAQLQATHIEKVLTPAATALEKVLGDKDYFVGGKLTVADVHSVNLLESSIIAAGDQALWDKFPCLKALHQRVMANDKIAAWIKKRPESPY
jgi:glutathione S-transferase